jgi:uncharacterized protein YndB with AHSA1/START domain
VAENQIVVDAPRGRVFAVLADPGSYAEWVLGAKAVREADSTWPAPGSLLHHSSGAGPVTIDDSTEVLECDPPRRIVLLARLGPVGAFRVELVLDAVGEGRTTVTMREEPEEGIVQAIGPVGDAVGALRNKLSLRSLKRLAEG